MAASLAIVACDGGDGGGLPVAAECEITPPARGLLRADGRRLIDEGERIVTLRGVNAGGRSKFAPYAPFDFDPARPGSFEDALDVYLDRAAAWGFDVLRVPFSWAAAEPEPGMWDEAWLARYDQILDGAWERGVWTIVDFHQDVYAEAFCGDGFPPWTLPGMPADPPPPRHDCPDWFMNYSHDEVEAAFDGLWGDTEGAMTAFESMWDTMAARHADRPGVLGFEIINEPSEGSMATAAWERDVLTAFYTRMIARLQAVDPDALVFLDAGGTAAIAVATDLDRPDGDNIVFAPHYYQPGALFGGGIRRDVGDRLQRWSDVGDAWQVPVLIGEFGIDASHPDVYEYLGLHYDAFDAQGLHATFWEYSDAAELWNEEDLSLVGPDGSEREAMLDAIVRPYARAVAGTPSSASYDAGAGVFTLAYEATAGGITEIVAPVRAYPEGLEVRSDRACVDVVDGAVYARSESGGATLVEVAPR